eukprot:m.63473 g.63473  ORF g.63473 m.63473 type:complete len:417 (+) comp12469_c2_seq2:187-1437(+)
MSFVASLFARGKALPEIWGPLVAARRSLQGGHGRYAPVAQVRCQNLFVESGGIRIAWGDGHESFFHSVWLRDHSPNDFHPSSGQRQIDTVSIPLDISASKLTVSPCGRNVDVVWSDMSFSTFSLKWLRANCYSPSEIVARSKSIKVKPITWDASRFYGIVDKHFNYHEFVNDDTTFRNAMTHLLAHGALFFEGIPPELKHTKAIADRIGVIRHTFYGGIWDTKPKADVNDTAYTNIELKPHTDATYFTDSPALQFFNCIEQRATGGDTWLVDGFSIAEKIREEHPEVFEFFSTRTIPFFHKSKTDGVHMLAHGKVFELDVNGAMKQFRYNNDDRAPLNTLPPEDVALFYKYLRVLNSVTLDPTLSGFFKLKVGSGVLVHNHRVLHGRRSFVGARNLQGWYVGNDELNSCLRLLGLL